MHGTTEVERRYDPPRISGRNDVDVKIKVEGADGEEALELANILHETIEETHREYQDENDPTV